MKIIDDSSSFSFWYSRIFVGSLCVLPVAGMVVPRVLAYAPGIIGLFGVLALRFFHKTWPPFPRNLFLLMFVIVFLAALSALWSVDPGFALERSGKMALILLGGGLLFSLAQNVNETQVLLFQKIFPWAVLAMGVLCAFDLYSTGAFYRLLHSGLPKDQMNLSFLNRGTVFFTFCLFPAVALMRMKKPISKGGIAFGIALAVVTAAVFYKTNSQSAQLAFLVAVLTAFLFPYRLKTAWWGLAVVIFMLISSAPLLAPFLFKNLAPLLAHMEWFSEGYAANRLEIWDFISRRIWEQPFYGSGIESTRFITDFDTQRLYNPTTAVLHPHNFVLQLWIEFGVLGAALAVGFVGYVLFVLQRLRVEASRLALPVFLAVFCVASTGYGLWQSWWLGTFTVLAVFVFIAIRAIPKTASP